MDPIRQRLAEAYRQQQAGQLDAALEGYRLVLLLDPTNAQAHQLIGILHFQAGKPEDADPSFDRINARCSRPKSPTAARDSASPWSGESSKSTTARSPSTASPTGAPRSLFAFRSTENKDDARA